MRERSRQSNGLRNCAAERRQLTLDLPPIPRSHQPLFPAAVAPLPHTSLSPHPRCILYRFPNHLGIPRCL